MAKKIISDIIIVSKKSIRQIPISAEKKQLEDLDISRIKSRSSWQRRPMNPKLVIWLIAGICLLALFFGISIFFSSATIIVTPRTEKINFNNDAYVARTNASSTSGLTFEVLSVKRTAGEIISATEQKDVNQKASGVIVIYNNYSSAPQRLINNTRFEATSGRIYRISSSVVVPGLIKSGGKIVPGSIEATVYADQAGDSYNLKLADLAGDFRIPGFKGDPRYDGFYARLKTDILGGFIGKQMIVSDALRKATLDSLRTTLKELLLQELYAIKPDNYLIFSNGYSIDYIDQPDATVDADRVKINLEGDINSIVFNNLKLAKFLATQKINTFDGLPVEFVPADNLTATITGKDSTGLSRNDTLQVKLNGDATIKWVYDTEAIKKDFAGKSESDLNNLFAKYKDTVASFRVIFIPVWTRYFPDNTNKINLKEEIPA